MKKIEPIIVEQAFNTGIQKVWDALTLPEQKRQWFFTEIPDFRAEVGFTTQFDVAASSQTFLHIWKVIEVIPLEKLVVNWSYDGFDADADVIFELSGNTEQTHLKVIVHGIEKFPQSIPEFKRESCQGGWKYFINQRLVDFLEP